MLKNTKYGQNKLMYLWQTFRCEHYQKKKKEHMWMGVGEIQKQAWQNVEGRWYVHGGSLYSIEICLEIFMIKTFKLFSLSLQSFVEKLFTYNKV